MNAVNAAVRTAEQNGARGQDLEDVKIKVQTAIASFRSEPNRTYISSLERLTEAMENLAILTTQLSVKYAAMKKSPDAPASTRRGKMTKVQRQKTDQRLSVSGQCIKRSWSVRLAIMPAEPASRPWQQIPAFSVRGMIVLVFVISAGLGWLVHSAGTQRDAVAAIEKAGGEVEYAWGWPPTGRFPAPMWLTGLIGDDYFGHAIDVRFSPSSAPTDKTMVQLGRLTRLQRLWLDSTELGDAGLVQLKGLPASNTSASAAIRSPTPGSSTWKG